MKETSAPRLLSLLFGFLFLVSGLIVALSAALLVSAESPNSTSQSQSPPCPPTTLFLPIIQKDGVGLRQHTPLATNRSTAQTPSLNYRDDFDSDTGWEIRRNEIGECDTNTLTRTVSNTLVLKHDGQWDYSIASPFVAHEGDSYRVSARVRLNNPINLGGYGIVFGADGNAECTLTNNTDCFTTYYSVLVLNVGDDGSQGHMIIQRYDGFRPNGKRNGTTLWNSALSGTNLASYHDIVIDVSHGNDMSVTVDGVRYAELNDIFEADSLRPYFGVQVATDEYYPVEAEFDYFELVSLP